MSDPENQDTEMTEQQPDTQENSLDLRKLAMEEDLNNPVTILERVYKLCWNCADFHLFITTPHIDTISPPVRMMPDTIPGTNELEHVYPIYDSGYKLSTSKAEDMMTAGMSMCKLFYTIEKMIGILITRLKAGGVSPETEVQIAFGGFELAQRKAFESVINLNYNVVVTNYEPGAWGEQYLENVKRMSEKYGYPPEAPRETYKQSHTSSSAGIKR